MRELNSAEMAQVEGGAATSQLLEGDFGGFISCLLQELILAPILGPLNQVFESVVDAITDFVNGLFGVS